MLARKQISVHFLKCWTIPLMNYLITSRGELVEFHSPLSFPAGLHERACNVVPKDLYIEVGSSAEIVCQTSCVHGKIFWTLNNRHIDESLSKTVNSSHAVLSLSNVTNHIATLQCHSADTRQVLGGTTLRTYSKKRFWYLQSARWYDCRCLQ